MVGFRGSTQETRSRNATARQGNPLRFCYGEAASDPAAPKAFASKLPEYRTVIHSLGRTGSLGKSEARTKSNQNNSQRALGRQLR